MVLRVAGTLLVSLLLAAGASANAAPQSQSPGETIVIPFEPPLDQSVRYRSETSEQKDGRTKMSWSVESYRFEETKGGYRLSVEPVSSGSNEHDPVKLEFMKRLEELTKQPFVLRLNEDADIVELERGDEYWSKIIRALREAFSEMKPRRPEQEKLVEALVGLYENMPPETRLAKLTESIQPLVDFAWTETSIGKPIVTAVETASPLGPVKQEVAITLTKVSDGFAYLTIRSGIPSAELKKLTAAMFDKLNNGALKPEDVAKAKAHLNAAKDFNAETVADYKISTDDGMLESFYSTRAVTARTEGDRLERKTKTLSIKRID